jgi:hypothetical protein
VALTTKLLEEASRKVRELPESRQDGAAGIFMSVVSKAIRQGAIKREGASS